MAKLQILPLLLLWIGSRSKHLLSSNQGPFLLFLNRGPQFPGNGWDSSDTSITSSLGNQGSLCPLGATKPTSHSPWWFLLFPCVAPHVLHQLLPQAEHNLNTCSWQLCQKVLCVGLWSVRRSVNPVTPGPPPGEVDSMIISISQRTPQMVGEGLGLRSVQILPFLS